MAASSTLWPIFFFSLFIAWVSDKRSKYTYGSWGQRIYQKKELFFFVILVVSMSVFIGLRIWCNDTQTYREQYVYFTASSGPLLRGIDWAWGASPAFQMVNTILKRLHFSSQSYLMIYAIVTNAIYLWFIRKYSSDFWLSVFFFWTMGVFTFTAAAIRQCIATAFGLIAIDRLLTERKRSFYLWILFASFFHMYVLLFLIVPLLQFKPWTNSTWYLFGLSAVVGMCLHLFIGPILDVTSMFGMDYAENEFSGEGVNVFRLLVIWSPIILSFFARHLIRRGDNPHHNLFMNLSMLNATLMFVALFGTANYFARLANYFLFFQLLSLPCMLRYFKPSNRKLLKIIIIVCYFAYFFYANVIHTPFNRYFNKMTLIEYFGMIFE